MLICASTNVLPPYLRPLVHEQNKQPREGTVLLSSWWKMFRINQKEDISTAYSCATLRFLADF